MTGFLRFIRGIIGLIFGLKAVDLFTDAVSFVGWLQNNPSYSISPTAISIDLVVLLLSALLFDWLRTVINRRHLKTSGSSTLLPNRWSL